MPYNNTPISPPKDATGQVSLPLARIKKIIHADEDISNCSNNAAFVITIATEMFIQHLVERSFEIAKAEKRGKKSLQYLDVANAVARLDNLEFLADVVPRTTTYRKFVSERGKNYKPGAAQASIIEGSKEPSDMLATEEPTPSRQHLSLHDLGMNGAEDADAMDVEDRPIADHTPFDPIQEQLAMEMARQQERLNGTYG